MRAMTKILIVEDDPQMRARYAQNARPGPVFEVTASVGTGGEGMAMVDLRKPDVLLIDLGLPDMSGIRSDSPCHAERVKCDAWS